MDPTTITTLISSVGFPIACCCYLFWQQERQRETYDQLREAINELKNNLKCLRGDDCK